MIVPLGKHLRKWLLSVAVAARNRVQTVVAALEYAQEEEAGPEIAPGGAKKAPPGGPPDHWLQLVERHAPELLQSGLPEVVSRSPSPVPDRGAGVDRSDPEDARELKPDRVASAKADQSRLFASSRAPQEYDRPNRKQKAPAQVHPGQAGDNNAIAGRDATSPDHIRGGAAILDPAAIRPGPVRPAGEEKTMHRPTLDRERYDSFIQAEGSETKSRAAEGSNKRSVVSRGFKSTGDQIENQRAGAGEAKSIKAPEPTAGRVEPIFPTEPERSTGSTGDARMAAPEKIKQDAGIGTPPGPGGSSRKMASAPNTGGQASASQSPVGQESVRPVSDARITSGQHHAYRRQEGEKDPEKALPPAAPPWPGLPGEEESEDIRDSDLTAAWPDLPEKQSAEVTSPSNQMESYRTTAGSRDMERLRRLDEEQKGRSWNASHF